MYVRTVDGTQRRTPNPECPVEVGDKVRFVPSANKGASAGFGGELRVEVTATVIQVNEDHRWYRTAWEMCPGCTGHETFKF